MAMDMTLCHPRSLYRIACSTAAVWLLALLAGCGSDSATDPRVEPPPTSQGTSLAFVAPPGRAEGQVAFAPALEVEVKDKSGKRLGNWSASITLSLKGNPSKATLGGTLTRPATNGVARFDDLTIDLPGTGYTLRAVSGALEVESAPFDAGLTMAMVSAGGDYSCGVTKAGKGYCWGRNYNGELGSGLSALNSSTPVPIRGALNFAMLSVGNHHSCGVTTEGKAYCWGVGGDGQLGNGGTAQSNIPVAVSGNLTFKSVSAAFRHSCGITTTGQGYCWGYGGDGELGTGGTAASTTPVLVSGGLAFAAISAGDYHSCGVTTASRAYCWGVGTNGQLGNGTLSNSLTPREVSGSLAFLGVSAGGLHSCGLTASDFYCWGFGGAGALGNGSTAQRTSPVKVSFGPGPLVQLSAGITHTCGIIRTGEAYCWGTGDVGQLGPGAGTQSLFPVLVSDLTFGAVSAGNTHTCGVTPTGEAYCWGSAYTGELGNGSDVPSSVPVLVFGTKH